MDQEIIRILYVDDYPLDRALVRDALTHADENFELIETASKEDFHVLLPQGGYDLVLSDFNILGFTGLEVLESVQNQLPGTPVIIVTGTGSEEVAAEAIKRGAADYVIKSPSRIRRLPHIIVQALEANRLRTQRQFAEQALRASEEKYRLIFEQSPAGIVHFDENGIITDCNDRFCEIIGAAKENLIGFNMVKSMPVGLARQAILDTLETGFGHFEGQYFTVIGNKKIIIKAEHRTILDQNGNFIGATGIFEDISERKLAEAHEREARLVTEALRDTAIALSSTLEFEQVLDRILENIGRLILVDAVNFMLIEGDEATIVRHHGYSELDVNVWNQLSLKISDRPNLAKMWHTKKPILINETRNSPDWEAVDDANWIRSYAAVPIVVEDGDVIGFLNLDHSVPNYFELKHVEWLFDFSEQVAIALKNAQTQQALQESQRTLSALMSNLPGMAYRCLNNADRKMLFVSEGCRELTGYARKDILLDSKMPYRKIIHPEDRNIVWGEAQKSIAIHQPFQVTYRIIRSDGSERWVWEKGSAVEVHKDKSDLIEGFITDITNLKQAEDALLNYTSQLEILYRASLAFGQLENPEDIGKHILETLEKILDFYRGVIILRSQSTQEFELLALSQKTLDAKAYDAEFARVGQLLQSCSGITHHVANSGERFRSGNVKTEPRYIEADPLVRSEMAVPMKIGNQVVGAINIESNRLNAFSDEDERILSTLANQAAIALQNAQTQKSLRQRSQELQLLTARLVEAEETERRRLARELHDQVGQSLAILGLNLNLLGEFIPSESEAAKQQLSNAEETLLEISTQIRAVMDDLRPSILDDYGLYAALNWFADRFSDRTGIQTKISGKTLSPRLNYNIENAFFRITQEALSNIAAHAKADLVRIRLRADQGQISLTIEDNGIGFQNIAADSPIERRGWGLANMKERADFVGATFEIDSTLGAGSTIRITYERPEG